MSVITGRTRGGIEWVPLFAVAIDGKKCIGCGRCYKVCPRDVLDLVERSEEMMADIDEDDLDDEQMMVMSLKNAADCIGCGSCGRVCPKGWYTYASADA